MAIEFCPLEAAWGNWADWAAVVVGLGAAAGTIWVARVANRTSARAAEIAEDAKAIAKQQRDEVVALQKANAEILGRLLLHEISSLPARLNSVLAEVSRSVSVKDGKIQIDNPDRLEEIFRDTKFSMLPESERVLDRIHDLPDRLGPDLATLIGHCGTLKDMAYRMHARVAPNDRQHIGQWYPKIYKGRPDDFELLEEHLKFFKDLSIQYANRFRGFVGVDAENYGRFA